MNEQQTNLNRVSTAISQIVTDFWSERINKEFLNCELHSYVASKVTIAPGSADRVLRMLRKKHVVNYEVVNRAKSLYKALPVTKDL